MGCLGEDGARVGGEVPRACVATRASTPRPGVRPLGLQGGNGSLRCERLRLDVRRNTHYIDSWVLASLQAVKSSNLTPSHVRRPGRRPGPVAPVSGSNPRHGGPRAHRDPRPVTQQIGARTGSTKEDRLCRAPSATACLSTSSGAMRTRGSRKGSTTRSGVCVPTVPPGYAVSGILGRLIGAVCKSLPRPGHSASMAPRNTEREGGSVMRRARSWGANPPAKQIAREAHLPSETGTRRSGRPARWAKARPAHSTNLCQNKFL